MKKKSTKRLIALALAAVMTLGLATVATADNAHFIFTDIDEPQPDLYVAKTVSSAMEGYTAPDTTFTFVLHWDQDGDGYLEFADNEIYFVYNEDGTQVYNEETGSYIFRTSSTGRFTLKDGQYARFEWAGQVAYQVTELDADSFINMSGEMTGTVDAEGTFLTFENLYVPPDDGEGGNGDTTQLIIRKDISWPNGYETPALSDVEFTFEIKIDGTAYVNQAYEIYDAGVSTQTGSGHTDGNGYFTMTGDSAIVFPDVEVGVDYEVKEVEEDNEAGWRATGQTFYAGATKSPMVYCYFANGGAEFVVKKDRTDGVVGTEFEFILSDENDVPMADIPYYIYDAKGNLTGSGVTDEEGNFVLCAGERVIFTGIPDGAEYKITETAGDGFLVTADGKEDSETTDTEDYDSIDTHTFVNEKLTDIMLTKYGSRLNTERNLLAGAEFTIYVLDENGEYTKYEHFGTEENSATLITGEDGTLTFKNLPAGTYRIVETKTPAGYVTAGDPIEVTLPYMLENEVEGSVYSERDGVYYLYRLNYTVDNAAVLQMPNTGGRAWIIIVIAICGGAAALGSVYRYRRRHGGKEQVRA